MAASCANWFPMFEVLDACAGVKGDVAGGVTAARTDEPVCAAGARIEVGTLVWACAGAKKDLAEDPAAKTEVAGAAFPVFP